jgi:hypothetical protein
VRKKSCSVENFRDFGQKIDGELAISLPRPNLALSRFGIVSKCFMWNNSRFGLGSKIVFHVEHFWAWQIICELPSHLFDLTPKETGPNIFRG